MLPRIAIVCFAVLVFVGVKPASAQSSLAPIYRVVVEVTHFNGSVYYSTAYETTDPNQFYIAKIAYQSAYENGDLQAYFGSKTSYISGIYFPTIYPQLTATRTGLFTPTSRFSATRVSRFGR